MFLRHASAGGSSLDHELVGYTVVILNTTPPVTVCMKNVFSSHKFREYTRNTTSIYSPEERVQIKAQETLGCAVCVPLLQRAYIFVFACSHVALRVNKGSCDVLPLRRSNLRLCNRYVLTALVTAFSDRIIKRRAM